MQNQDIIQAIQATMRDAFPEVAERVAPFYAMQEYHLGWRDLHLQPATSDPGKLIRPQLTLLACLSAGGDMVRALPLAAGIQLIHDFSLIHDDIEDQSDTRRGRVTVWKHWGLAQGINTGDGMFVIAHLSLHRLTEQNVPPGIVLEVLRRFDQTILTICEGQYLDLSYEGNLTIQEDDYLAMISRKTAALLSCATGLGALIGGASLEQAQALFDFGQNLGLAFQIQDDILGIWGAPEQTGKPYAADLYRRKVSLPVVHALRYADEQATLARLYAQDELTEPDVQQALAILAQAGSREYTAGVAAHYHQQALQSLARFPAVETPTAREAMDRLHAIADRLKERQS